MEVRQVAIQADATRHPIPAIGKDDKTCLCPAVDEGTRPRIVEVRSTAVALHPSCSRRGNPTASRPVTGDQVANTVGQFMSSFLIGLNRRSDVGDLALSRPLGNCNVVICPFSPTCQDGAHGDDNTNNSRSPPPQPFVDYHVYNTGSSGGIGWLNARAVPSSVTVTMFSRRTPNWPGK